MKIHKPILPLIDQDERRRSNIFATPDPFRPRAKWCTITSSFLLSSAAKSIHPSWHFLSRSCINERIRFLDCVVNSGSLPGVSSRKPKIKLCITEKQSESELRSSGALSSPLWLLRASVERNEGKRSPTPANSYIQSVGKRKPTRFVASKRDERGQNSRFQFAARFRANENEWNDRYRGFERPTLRSLVD